MSKVEFTGKSAPSNQTNSLYITYVNITNLEQPKLLGDVYFFVYLVYISPLVNINAINNKNRLSRYRVTPSIFPLRNKISKNISCYLHSIPTTDHLSLNWHGI